VRFRPLTHESARLGQRPDPPDWMPVRRLGIWRVGACSWCGLPTGLLVEEATFVLPEGDTGRIENAWAVHRVQSTVDFARKSRLLACVLGGLNSQIEHHLFPHICLVNYPALAHVVEAACRDYRIKHSA